MIEEIQKENLEAFERLLNQKEIEENGRLGNYRYYRDKYNNKYGWYTNKQKDGKFHAFIFNSRSRKTRIRIFAKKKTAKKWCLHNYSIANSRQIEVIQARKKRKEENEAKKPKLTPTQISIINAENKIWHYKELQGKCNRKIKSLQTRNRTYQKRIKYHQKRLGEIN